MVSSCDLLRARFHWSLPMDAKSLSLTCASRESISPRALTRIADGRSWFLCGSIMAAPLIATLTGGKSSRLTSIVTKKDMLISGQSLSRKISSRTAKTTGGLKTSCAIATSSRRPSSSKAPLHMIKEVRMLLESYYRWLRKQTTLREIKDWIEIATPYLDRHNDCLQIYVRRAQRRVRADG